MKKYLLFFAVLVSCNVGPRYVPPCVEVPEEWKNRSEDCASMPFVCNWWEIFQDETLNSLAEQAVEHNPTLDVALYSIEQAWAIAGISRSALFPHLDLDPSYNNYGELFKIFLPGNLPIPGLKNIAPFRIHQLQYTLPLMLSYEVDLWGQYRNHYLSDLRNVEAQEDAYRAALLSLTSNLASSYFNLRALDARVELLFATIDQRRKEYELNLSRHNKGLSNYSDVVNASLELTNAESDYYDSVRQRGLLEDMIGALIGVPASNFILPSMPLREDPPVIPAGIPSHVVMRRPDIAEAERQMAAQHALVGAAYASFFPSFQLTGILGYLSPDFRQFLSTKSRYWSMGANVGQTVFDAGSKYSNLQAAWARFDEASGTYKQQVLTAFQEVEDALNNLEQQAKQAVSLKSSSQSAETAVKLSRHRYRSGLANYIEVVVNEQNELTAQQLYINLLGQRYISTVQLIKALGGSWDDNRAIPAVPLR